MARKTDRRTIMTKIFIKDALLELLNSTTYEKISITALCKQADITRATFYLHYDNLDEVIDEILDDALRITELSSSPQLSENIAAKDPDITLPTCQRATSQPKYKKLFLDDSLSNIILNKLYKNEYDIQVPRMMQLYKIDRAQAEKLFLYTLHGNFALNKAMGWKRTDEWYAMQNLISKILSPNGKF